MPGGELSEAQELYIKSVLSNSNLPHYFTKITWF